MKPSKSVTMKPRHVLTILLCLLVGFVVQTLLGWALFIHSDYTGGTGIVRDPILKPGDRTDTGFVLPPDWQQRTQVQWWGVGKTRETVSECVWVGSTLGTMSGLGRQATFQGFSAGWPMRSLCGRDYIAPSLEAQAPMALCDVPGWIKSGGYKVPVSPLWMGLVVNALLFAIPVLAGTWVVACARRRRRRRLGLCLKCAYSVKGLERCPECGGSVETTGPT